MRPSLGGGEGGRYVPSLNFKTCCFTYMGVFRRKPCHCWYFTFNLLYLPFYSSLSQFQAIFVSLFKAMLLAGILPLQGLIAIFRIKRF